MFYVIESATVDGTVAKAVTTKETYREATMLFHQIMASMMANDNVEFGFCTILDNSGRQMFDFTQTYSNPKPVVAE